MKALITALLLVSATAAADCPKAVTDGIAKAYPKSKVDSCKPEKSTFEAKITKADGGKLEVDVGADGAILGTEDGKFVEEE